MLRCIRVLCLRFVLPRVLSERIWLILFSFPRLVIVLVVDLVFGVGGTVRRDGAWWMVLRSFVEFVTSRGREDYD